ncbi:hypothetical protein D3C85_1117770 [compost metagenome]
MVKNIVTDDSIAGIIAFHSSTRIDAVAASYNDTYILCIVYQIVTEDETLYISGKGYVLTGSGLGIVYGTSGNQ